MGDPTPLQCATQFDEAIAGSYYAVLNDYTLKAAARHLRAYAELLADLNTPQQEPNTPTQQDDMG